jgi:hypothetical protein
MSTSMASLIACMIQQGVGLRAAEVSPESHFVLSILLWAVPVPHSCCLGLTSMGSLLLSTSIIPNASLHRWARAVLALIVFW